MTDITFTERKSKQLKERSSSARNLKVGRQIRNIDYYGGSGRGTEGLHGGSKVSKEYPKVEYDYSNQKAQSKNLNENNDYIKSLYKKYLGKQNANHSERKQKIDPRVSKVLFAKDDYKDTQPSCKPLIQNTIIMNPSKTQESLRDFSKKEIDDPPYYNSKYSLSKNKSIVSVQLQKQSKLVKHKQENTGFYFQMMNEQYLQMFGNPRSSLVRCLKNICRAKKIAANHQ